MGKREQEYEAFKQRLIGLCQLSFNIGQLARAFTEYDPYGKQVVRLGGPYFDFGAFFPIMDEELEALLRWAYYGDSDALTAIYGWYREKDDQHKRSMEQSNRPTRVKEKPKRVGYIYVMQSQDRYKIGKSIRKGDRVSTHLASSPYPLTCILEVRVANFDQVEQEIHACFATKCVKTEWFTLDERDLQALEIYLKQRDVS